MRVSSRRRPGDVDLSVLCASALGEIIAESRTQPLASALLDGVTDARAVQALAGVRRAMIDAQRDQSPSRLSAELSELLDEERTAWALTAELLGGRRPQ